MRQSPCFCGAYILVERHRNLTYFQMMKKPKQSNGIKNNLVSQWLVLRDMLTTVVREDLSEEVIFELKSN